MRKGYSKNGITILCSLVYFVSYFSRKDFAAVMADMLSQNILDRSTAGLVGTMLFIFYGIGQLLSGYLGDKIKPAYIIIFGLGLTAVSNLLMPLAPTSTLMIPIWAVNGFAQAMLWPPIVKILSTYLSHESYVKANLVVTSAAHIATILLYLYVPLCLTLMSWQTVFYTASILAAVTMVCFVFALRIVLPKEAEVKSVKIKIENSDNISIFKMLIDAGIIPIFACIVVTGFIRDGIESWLPTLYSEAFQRDSTESILVSVILPIFSILSITVVTALHKKPIFNNETKSSGILFAISIVLCIPLAILINNKTLFARVTCLVLAAIVCAAMHGVNFLLISCLPGRFAPYGRSSTVSGLTNAFIYVGAAASMFGIALISENLGWSATAISWIIILTISTALAAVAYGKYSRFIKNNT